MTLFCITKRRISRNRLRDLPFMDLYVRIDKEGKGTARYRTPGRDVSNNWSRILPDAVPLRKPD